ncbi:MAG: hypothetical protein WCC46_01965, partial [Terriglobales bacterium]
ASASARNAQLFEEEFAVALYCRARVVRRETQIQGLTAVYAGNYALPGGEGMDQPRQFRQLLGMQ